METVSPKLGVAMSSGEAKNFVAQLNQKVIQRWKERVTDGPFMKPFLEGKLSRAAIKLLGQLHRRDQHVGCLLLSQAHWLSKTPSRSHGTVGNEDRR